MSFKAVNQLTKVETSFSESVKSSFKFKFRTYQGMFITMILIQMIATLFALGNNSFQLGEGISGYIYSGDIIIILTIVWAIWMTFMLTGQSAQNIMFTFVTNRYSHHVSNFIFIIVLSAIGGVTAYMLSFIFKIGAYLYNGPDLLLESEPLETIYILSGLVGTVFYTLLFSMLAYIIGTLVQWHRIFIGLVPVIFIALMSNFSDKITEFIGYLVFYENNLFIFVLNVSVITVILFLLSIFIGRRQEVRK